MMMVGNIRSHQPDVLFMFFLKGLDIRMVLLNPTLVNNNWFAGENRKLTV
jgi:hypothetical protein